KEAEWYSSNSQQAQLFQWLRIFRDKVLAYSLVHHCYLFEQWQLHFLFLHEHSCLLNYLNRFYGGSYIRQRKINARGFKLASSFWNFGNYHTIILPLVNKVKATLLGIDSKPHFHIFY